MISQESTIENKTEKRFSNSTGFPLLLPHAQRLLLLLRNNQQYKYHKHLPVGYDKLLSVMGLGGACRCDRLLLLLLHVVQEVGRIAGGHV